jgi:cell division protein FtsL
MKSLFEKLLAIAFVSALIHIVIIAIIHVDKTAFKIWIATTLVASMWLSIHYKLDNIKKKIDGGW